MTDLRAQAMERMKQLDSALPQELKEASFPQESDVPKENPPLQESTESKKTSGTAVYSSKQQDISSIFGWLGLDRDQVLLLLLLWFLYKDHASPRILLAVLYVML